MGAKNRFHSSSHGAVLLRVAADPGCTVDDLSESLFLTRRTVWSLIGDLRRAGMVHVRKRGRRHHYTVNPDAASQHPAPGTAIGRDWQRKGVSYMAGVDRGEPRPGDAIRDGMPAPGLSLPRCRDCKAPMTYGPAICSFCLSERSEWVSAKREDEGRQRGPG